MVGRSASTATYSVVTPLFLGDALRDASRLSLASFKGQLRFWWRALAWPRIGDLAKLHEREAWLFGKAGEAGEKAFGQSHLVLRLRSFRYDRLMAAAPAPVLRQKRFSTEHILNRDGTGATGDQPNGLQGSPLEDVIGEGCRYLGYGLL